MNTKERIKEIEERIAKATPGPWHYFTDGDVGIPSQNSNRSAYSIFPNGCPTGENDAELIAYATEDIQFLLDALKDAESENKALFDTNIEHESAIEENLAADRDRWKG